MEPQIKQMEAEELDVKLKEMGSPFFYQTLKFKCLMKAVNCLLRNDV